MADLGYLDFDKESEDLLRDSDEDGGGGEGMADEIANMLADLRTTGEAEDDANVDFSLEEQLLAVDAPPSSMTRTSESAPVVNPFQPAANTFGTSKATTATINPFSAAPPPFAASHDSGSLGLGARGVRGNSSAPINPFLASSPTNEPPPSSFQPPMYTPSTYTAPKEALYQPPPAHGAPPPLSPFSEPAQPPKPQSTTANPFAPSTNDGTVANPFAPSRNNNNKAAEAAAKARQLFQDVDKNNNGFLTKSEIRNYFKKHPAEKNRILGSDFKWKEFFTDMDTNGDNKFDVIEFTDFITRSSKLAGNVADDTATVANPFAPSRTNNETVANLLGSSSSSSSSSSSFSGDGATANPFAPSRNGNETAKPAARSLASNPNSFDHPQVDQPPPPLSPLGPPPTQPGLAAPPSYSDLASPPPPHGQPAATSAAPEPSKNPPRYDDQPPATVVASGASNPQYEETPAAIPEPSSQPQYEAKPAPHQDKEKSPTILVHEPRQQNDQELGQVTAALRDCTKNNARLTQEVADHQQELAVAKSELEQTKAALAQAHGELSTLKENVASLSTDLQKARALHKNETRVLAAEVHRLRGGGGGAGAVSSEQLSQLQAQHAKEVQDLRDKLTHEQSLVSKSMVTVREKETELNSTRQQMEVALQRSKVEQEALMGLRASLAKTQSQLEASRAEHANAKRLHETQLRAVYERLKVAETAAAAASQVAATAATAATAASTPPASTASAPPAAPAPAVKKDYYLGPFVADQVVEARWKTQPEWGPAQVISVNDDGTYRVVYNGRHVAGNVPQSNIRSDAPPPTLIPSVDDIPEAPPGYQDQPFSKQQPTARGGVGAAANSDDPAVLFPGHEVVDVVARRHPSRGFGLKFKLINSGSANQALYISEVADTSCGLQAEDKLFSVDGTRANSFRGLKPLIAEKTQITLRVLRVPVVAEVVQGVDLESLSTIELKKMLRERNLDTKCNRATAIKKLTMSLDHEADQEPLDAPRPNAKFRLVAVQARTLLSSRQSCLRALMQNTTNSENSWVMVDLRDMASPKGSIDSPLINEVLARWTHDRSKNRRFYMWMKHVVDGHLSGDGFAWSIEIPTLNLAALAGFVTKVVPLLHRLSPWAAVSVCVRHSREFSSANPMLLKPIEIDDKNDFTVDLRVCLNKFKQIDTSGLLAPKFALFGPGSEPIQMFLQSWTSDAQRISKMNQWLKMTAEGRFGHKGIELQSIRKEIVLAFLTLVVPLLRQQAAAKIVVSLRRARIGIRMAAAGRAVVEKPKMDLGEILEDVEFVNAEFDMQIAAIV